MNRINKIQGILFSTAALLGAVSCGTASYTSSGYANSIYMTAETATPAQKEQDAVRLDNLQARTTETIKQYSSTTAAQIETAAAIPLSEGETYEERLTKFDSPQYVVNIEVDYTPWYDWRYGYYHYYGWYDPFWGPGYHWGWYDPWYGPYWGWRDPWYGWGGYWGGWYDPWYGWGGYWGGWYNPWYPPYPGWYYPGHGHINARDRYYGRNNSSTYRNNTVANNQGGSIYRRNSSGTVTSRNGNYSQIRGDLSKPRTSTAYNPVTGNGSSSSNRSQSIYRRENTGRNNYVTTIGGNKNYNSNGSTPVYRRSTSNSGAVNAGNGITVYRRSGSSNSSSPVIINGNNNNSYNTYRRSSNTFRTTTPSVNTNNNSSYRRSSNTYSTPRTSTFTTPSAPSRPSAPSNSGGGSVYRRR